MPDGNVNIFMELLGDIVQKIVLGSITIEDIRLYIWEKLEPAGMRDSECLLVTDCYYALKHIEEEPISKNEWIYFLECFNHQREYDIKEKINYILGHQQEPPPVNMD